MNALEIHDLTKHFGSTQALRGISLSVEQGDIFGFLGPNGAGKSTTIRCIMDYIRPTGGTVTVLGRDASQQSVALKELIGYVPAEPNLYDRWTVDEHISFVAGIRDVKTHRAAELKRDLELAGQPQVRHLSTGNQQKLAIVLALMSDPELLILDEPTRGLDPLLQVTFHQLLREYQQRGGTVFLSSHNLTEVDELCTQVAVIRQGELVTSMSLAELKATSVHNVRAVFAGSVPDLRRLDPHDLVVTGRTATFGIRGDVNPALRALARHTLSDLEVTRVSLEQLFMELYQ